MNSLILPEADCRVPWCQEGKPQAVANTAGACSEHVFDATDLFAEIDRHAERLVKEGSPQVVSSTALVCGKLNLMQ